ncbi:MAG TPA: glycine betaine/L-proline ABC transporter ATP-binding protein [Afifellaceae bacterium]|nr:glycine betaine/L-proline ABC transporter ATP-binding protein [Afifellaceae bacterium]
MTDQPPKIQARGVFKVFGPDPQEALALFRAGRSKDDIHRDTGNILAVADVSFDVEEGETFVVMGLSGSGKSTLIRCVNRLIDPTAGEIRIGEEDIAAADAARLREIRLNKIAMVFQHFALFPHMSVADNAGYGLKARGIGAEERRERALAALDKVGLRNWADSYPDNLSGGMQQRVGLARALAVGPEILLMDEPFSALDPLIRRDMQDELVELQRDLKMTIVFITHDLHEALKLGDHVAIMKAGRFIQVGVPEEIVSGPADPYVSAFTQDVDRGRVLTVESVMKRTDVLVEGRDSVRTAAARMRELREDAIYVADREDRPLGLVLEADVVHAMRDKQNDLKAVMRADFPRTTADTALAEVYELCTSGLPIAVVGPRGRIRGVVHPLDVFAEISPRDNGAAAEPPAERAEAV